MTVIRLLQMMKGVQTLRFATHYVILTGVVRFDASTFVNGSENTQSINFQLPVAVDDLSVSGDDLITPWIGNTSPFGDGGARCANSLSVTINENESRTRVTLSPYSPNYNVTINGQSSSNQPNAGFNTYIIDFNQAFELGSTVSVNRNGFWLQSY